MRLLFSGLGILIYTGLCTYIGARLFGFFRYFLPGIKAVSFWLPFILLSYAFIAVNFLRLNRLNFLRQFSGYWMAVFMYLLMSMIVFDLLRLALLLFKRSALSPQFNAAGTAALLCLCFLAIAFGAVHARSIRTANYSVTVPGKGENLRIVLISDLHIGPAVNRAWVSRVADTINRAEPDIVCIAGDVFDGNPDSAPDLPGIAAEFRRIQAPLGVYACLGNHDTDRMFGGGTGRITEFLQNAGVVVLQDETAAVRENLYIAGRRDARPIGMSASRKTAAELLAGLDTGRGLDTGQDSDPSRTVIVLDHQPTQFAEIEQAGGDLALCGHTHKGQLFPANLMTRRIFKKAGGAYYGYWKGGALQAVVTSGAGVWGPPIRVGTNSEAAVIDIRFE